MRYCFDCGTKVEVTSHAGYGGMGVKYKCNGCKREFDITRCNNTYKVTKIEVTKQPTKET